jgi:hypothetical protein
MNMKSTTSIASHNRLFTKPRSKTALRQAPVGVPAFFMPDTRDGDAPETSVLRAIRTMLTGITDLRIHLTHESLDTACVMLTDLGPPGAYFGLMASGHTGSYWGWSPLGTGPGEYDLDPATISLSNRGPR